MSFVERVNSKNIDGIVAEPVRLDKVVQGAAEEYAVIIDRISQDVPFYRAYLKNAAICGSAVINNERFICRFQGRQSNNYDGEKYRFKFIGTKVNKKICLGVRMREEVSSRR